MEFSKAVGQRWLATLPVMYSLHGLCTHLLFLWDGQGKNTWNFVSRSLVCGTIGPPKLTCVDVHTLTLLNSASCRALMMPTWYSQKFGTHHCLPCWYGSIIPIMLRLSLTLHFKMAVNYPGTSQWRNLNSNSRSRSNNIKRVSYMGPQVYTFPPENLSELCWKWRGCWAYLLSYSWTLNGIKLKTTENEGGPRIEPREAPKEISKEDWGKTDACVECSHKGRSSCYAMMSRHQG